MQYIVLGEIIVKGQFGENHWQEKHVVFSVPGDGPEADETACKQVCNEYWRIENPKLYRVSSVIKL